MMYQSITTYVEAFQWTGKIDDATPEWFKQPHANGDISLHDASPGMLAMIHNQDGPQLAQPGDMIALRGDGGMWRYAKPVFDAMYEPTPALAEVPAQATKVKTRAA